MSDEHRHFVILESGQILDNQTFFDVVSADKYAKGRCKARHFHREGESCPYVLAEVSWAKRILTFRPLRT
jgi:hypothetical protein